MKNNGLFDFNQGTAHYESNFVKHNLVSINIGETITTKKEGKPEIYDECFQAILKDYKQNGKTTLKQDDLKAFVTRFKAECVRK